MNEKCSKCGAPSVYVNKHSGIKLCLTHLRQYVEYKVRRTIGKYRQLTETDHSVMYICSGHDIEKLLTLNKIEKEFPATKLEAIINSPINSLDTICSEHNIKLSKVNIEVKSIIHGVKSLYKISRSFHATKLLLPLTVTDISDLILWHIFHQINPGKLLNLVNSQGIVSPFMETDKNMWKTLSRKIKNNVCCILNPPKWFVEATNTFRSAYLGADFNILRSVEKLADGKS